MEHKGMVSLTFSCISFPRSIYLQLSPCLHDLFWQVERDQTYRRHSLARNFPPCRRLATRTKLAENRALQISGMGPDQASAPRVSNAIFVSNNSIWQLGSHITSPPPFSLLISIVFCIIYYQSELQWLSIYDLFPLKSINHTDQSVLSCVHCPQTLQVGGMVGAEPWHPPCLGRGQQRVALVELWWWMGQLGSPLQTHRTTGHLGTLLQAAPLCPCPSLLWGLGSRNIEGSCLPLWVLFCF